jgi:hypothetical protein
MRALLDPNNQELSSILKALLTENVEVTVREVARRHSCLKNPSAFTRNPVRSALIADAQVQQQSIREIVTSSRGEDAPNDRAEQRRAEIERLESQVTHLVAAHAGLIRAVQLAGGMAALERFWRDYKAVGDAVQALSAVPPTGRVIQLTTNSGEAISS